MCNYFHVVRPFQKLLHIWIIRLPPGTRLGLLQSSSIGRPIQAVHAVWSQYCCIFTSVFVKIKHRPCVLLNQQVPVVQWRFSCRHFCIAQVIYHEQLFATTNIRHTLDGLGSGVMFVILDSRGPKGKTGQCSETSGFASRIPGGQIFLTDSWWISVLRGSRDSATSRAVHHSGDKLCL